MQRCGTPEGQPLDPAFAEKFLTFIIAEVIRHHESIASHADDAEDAEDTADGPAPTAH